jgi:NifU-like protein
LSAGAKAETVAWSLRVTTHDLSQAQPSPAVEARLKRLGHVGDFTEANAQARGCSLITTEHGAQNAPDHLRLYLVVDAQGVVRDARFRSPATGDLLAAYDAMCELAVGKTVADAATITPQQVDTLLRAGSPDPAIPLSADADVPFYVLRKAAERSTPVARPADAKAFADCGLFEKVKRIEQVLDAHVRPALASDGGGLDLVDLKGNDLFVQYHGACGSCSSSVGGTLQFITESLNNHLAAALAVHVSGMDEEPPFTI